MAGTTQAARARGKPRMQRITGQTHRAAARRRALLARALRLLALAALASAAGGAGPAAAAPGAAPPPAPRVVVYPPTERREDARDRYPLELLELALARSGRAYALRPAPVFMLQGRSLGELERGQTVDVVWSMTTVERERALLPVRIPIDRGMLGWRVLMVREAELPRFAAITGTDELKRLRAGQGFDWPDAAILRAAGFEVDTSVRYEDIFLKLAGGRIDHFPRSVQEAWGELAARPGMGLAIEPGLALHYPTAMYFFVNRQQAALAADIRLGLERALADGSFLALFQRHYGAALKQAGLEGRRVIELPNPLLPPETPLGDRRLWQRAR